ncbi:hypothetical protein SAMN04488109_1770 [Chryseolinea serpens]|uniref:Uncharacterized protein n=1 Tax=Chryseolinea serpens TaxID=947013 RepID=A0A1M5MK33_9BACT|nr:hypothetical protein [Chryseolinea serpens]SHG77269.1 hypothetical protein SAMN04488109_1770 [Chryseolinea serpens]
MEIQPGRRMMYRDAINAWERYIKELQARTQIRGFFEDALPYYQRAADLLILTYPDPRHKNEQLIQVQKNPTDLTLVFCLRDIISFCETVLIDLRLYITAEDNELWRCQLQKDDVEKRLAAANYDIEKYRHQISELLKDKKSNEDINKALHRTLDFNSTEFKKEVAQLKHFFDNDFIAPKKREYIFLFLFLTSLNMSLIHVHKIDWIMIGLIEIFIAHGLYQTYHKEHGVVRSVIENLIGAIGLVFAYIAIITFFK